MLINRNVFLGKRRTSIRLEPELWTLLEQIAKRRSCTISEFVGEVDFGRDGSRTSAVRVAVVMYWYREAMGE